MKFLASVFFYFFIGICSSQNQIIDSLKDIVEDTSQLNLTRIEAQESIVLKTLYFNQKKGFEEVKKLLSFSKKYNFESHELYAYHCLVYYYRKIDDLDSAFFYNNKYLETALKRKKGYHFARALIDRAVLFEFSGDYEESLKQYLEAIDTAIKYKQNLAESRARINAGNLLHVKGDLMEALNQLKIALSIIDKKKYYGFKASALIYLGNIFESVNEYQIAENYYKESLYYSAMKSNNGTKKMAYIDLCKLYYVQNKFPEAIRFADSLLSLSEKIGLLDDQSYSFYLKSKIYAKQDKLDSARSYISKVFKLYDNVKIKIALYKFYSLAGEIELSLNNLDKAKMYLKKSYNLSVSKLDCDIQMVNCKCLYNIYKKEGNNKLALFYYEEEQGYLKKINEKNQIKEIVKFQINNQNQKKRLLDSLKNQNLLKTIQYELGYKEKQISNQKIWQDRLLLIIFSITLLLLGITVLFVQKKVQSNKINSLLEEKEVLYSELDHRVQNNYQTILSIIGVHQQKVDETTKEELQIIKDRISVISLLYNSMKNSFHETSLAKFINELIESLRIINDEKSTAYYEIEIDQIKVSNTIMIYIGIITNELITNFYKHSFRQQDSCSLKYSIKYKENVILINYLSKGSSQEKNGGTYKGLLIINEITKSLKGKVLISEKTKNSFQLELKIPHKR